MNWSNYCLVLALVFLILAGVLIMFIMTYNSNSTKNKSELTPIQKTLFNFYENENNPKWVIVTLIVLFVVAIVTGFILFR